MTSRWRTIKRRARLYGVSSDDPVLKHKRMPKTVFSKAAWSKKEVADTNQSRGQWYAGCTRIPPGSFSAACARYGGGGAVTLAARTSDMSAKSAGFNIAPHSELADKWSPPMLAKPMGYVTGLAAPYTTRNWPIEATYPVGFKQERLCNSEWDRNKPMVAKEHTRCRTVAQREDVRSQMAVSTSRLQRQVLVQSKPSFQGSRNVDTRAVEHHRKLISRNITHRRLPVRGSAPVDQGTLFVQSQSSLVLRSCGSSQKCDYSGQTVLIRYKETREEVVQRMHLERVRENDRQHHIRWVLLRAFLKACESHFMPMLRKRIVPIKFSLAAEPKQSTTQALLIDEIGELFLGDGIDMRLLIEGQTRCVIGTLHADTNHQPRLTPPSTPRVLHREKFMLVIQKHGINFPISMAAQFWDMIGQGNVLDVTRLLCSLRILIDANINPGSRASESIETKLDGLFEIYKKHCGKVDKLEEVFTVAAKSWEERKAIQDLLEKRFFPAITAIMHEQDQFSGKLPTSDPLPGLVLTQNVFNEGLRRCPDLVAEFITQLSHPTIQTYCLAN